MLGVAEHKRQVEDVDVVDNRANGSNGDPGHLQRAELGLLDHLLLAAKLHRREHLDRKPSVGGGFQLLAHAHHGFHGGIAERVDVGGLDHHFGLGQRGVHAARCRQRNRCGASAEKISSSHG